MKKIFILTGESSGELYGSLLARALKTRWKNISIAGVGGEMMKREGVELISEISGAFGLFELVSKLQKIRDTFNSVVNHILNEKPDVLVLVDFPDFNIKVARAVKHSGIKILYYVSPQVWAWRRKRVHTIAELVDRMAVILPFEVDYYKDTEMPCEFVGHPIVEEIEMIKGSKEFIKEQLGLRPDTPCLALLPGSRDSEMKRLLPVVEGVVDLFRRDDSGYQFIMPIALSIDRDKYSKQLNGLAYKGVKLVRGDAVKVLSSSDLALVASGTAALQAALLEIPLVVMYKMFPLSFWLGKMIIDVKFINLVNIMMDEEIIKEMLQGKANPGDIYNELKRAASDDNTRQWMIDNFRKVRGLFANKNASERVSIIIGELGGWE